MMIETSAYYGQPATGPLPFAPQAGYGTTAAQYGLPIWQLLGGPLAQPQFWGQFAPPQYQHPQPWGQFAPPQYQHPQPWGQFAPPQYQHPQPWGQFGAPQYQHPQPWGQFGAPFHQYGSFAGPTVASWLGQPPLGFPLTGGQLARPPLLEAYSPIPLTAAFAPHGFVGNQIGGPVGGLGAPFGQRGFGTSAFPFPATAQLAYVG